ncbi:FAD/NAD(P)-binding protein [uncultured Roseibium sp.]|uniref:FAD/NAD(P)-binding protein n=1 Tax=uncultured Roseibium sp. TaxID=1936171 RepID=UPI003216F677
MKTAKAAHRIALIGMGPRGLGALEALAERIEDAGLTLDLDIFDPVAHAGAGPNFDPDQSEFCLLNLPVREISLAPATYTGARTGTFADFLSPPADPDTFPSRAQLGRYLAARYEDLTHNALSMSLTRHKVAVDGISRGTDGWRIAAGGDRYGPYEEVLLTQGQPATAPDDQLERWQSHARACKGDLMAAYPANALLKAAGDWTGRTVAIRGLGLSTLDVLRLLTLGLGGRFADGRYRPSGREPARILPFSLNGHAPFPKPATASLDGMFDPLPDETCTFAAALEKALSAEPEKALEIVCEALLVPTARILAATGSPADISEVQTWLATEREDPGAQETQSPKEALRAGIEIADGIRRPSPGYVIGQLWRKWQNALRRGFNPAEIEAKTRSAVIHFDEGLKRYSYGPPIASAKELLMLITAGMVDLRAADDPDIFLTPDGWRLSADEAEVSASVMIDAVMPPPALDQSTDPVITDLMDQGRLVAVADGFGGQTRADGQLLDSQGNLQRGLSLLGRMSLGSVIAVDSIHDCMGAAAGRWAEGVVARLR